MNLEKLTYDYACSDDTTDLVRKSRIVLLAGIAGAGKDTLKGELLKEPIFRDIVSHTTRSPRRNNGVLEENGKDYHFIDTTEAAEMIKRHDFVEVKCVHGDTVYGTSAAEIESGTRDEKILVTDVDIQGVDEYKAISSDVTAIFLLPPNYTTWRERLMKRYDTTEMFESEWPKRKASALRELEMALAVPYYHFIINDQLERSVRVVHEISMQPDSFHRKDDEARIAARDLLDSLAKGN